MFLQTRINNYFNNHNNLVLEWLSLHKSGLGEGTNEQSPDCECLQSCLEIEYDADTSNAVFDLRIFGQNNPDIATERYDI